MEYLETNIDQIRLWVKEIYAHRTISDTLRQNFLEVTRGFSERSIRLFCSQHKIHKRSDLEVDIVLSKIRYARYVLKCTFIICVEKLHTVTQYIASYRVLSSFMLRLNFNQILNIGWGNIWKESDGWVYSKQRSGSN